MKQPTSTTACSAENAADRSLMCSLAVSVLGILLSVVCLAGLTWAWYTRSAQSGVNKLVAASFDVTVTVAETGGDDLTPAEGSYTLLPEKNYTVTLQPVNTPGSASSGYCQLCLTQPGAGSATAYYTPGITGQTSFAFTVTGFTCLSVCPMWGQQPAGLTAQQLVEADATLTGVPILTASPSLSVPESETEQLSEQTSEQLSEQSSEQLSEQSSEQADQQIAQEQAAAEQPQQTAEQQFAEQPLTEVQPDPDSQAQSADGNGA